LKNGLFAIFGSKNLFTKKIFVGAGSVKIYAIKSITYKNPPFFNPVKRPETRFL
jgi:hypothetical protein